MTSNALAAPASAINAQTNVTSTRDFTTPKLSTTEQPSQVIYAPPGLNPSASPFISTPSLTPSCKPSQIPYPDEELNPSIVANYDPPDPDVSVPATSTTGSPIVVCVSKS